MGRKKKPLVDVVISHNNYPNLSVAPLEGGGRIQFKNGVPGQRVKIKPLKKKGENYKGNLLEILEKSPLETETGCVNNRLCGGCLYQQLPYEEEVEIKKIQMESLFDHLGKVKFYESPKIVGYRGKMEYTFGDDYRDGPVKLGLNQRGRTFEVVNTLECNIVISDFERIRLAVERYFQREEKTPYHFLRKVGFLRNLIIRYSQSKEELMINLVTTTQDKFDQSEFVAVLQQLALEKKIVSILHTVSDSYSNAVYPEKIEVLFGRDYIVEELFGLTFEISPFSFFQPNVYTARLLYEKVLFLLGERKYEKIYDLFSGTGTIAQILSGIAEEVVAIELVEEAVDAAKKNAKRNGIENVTFYQGDVFEVLKEQNETPEAIVLDPPRGGIHPKALEKILELEVETIVYVSCNPKSQREDLKAFLEKGYKVEEIHAYDQFPRTYHVETIVLMSKIE